MLRWSREKSGRRRRGCATSDGPRHGEADVGAVEVGPHGGGVRLSAGADRGHVPDGRQVEQVVGDVRQP